MSKHKLKHMRVSDYAKLGIPDGYRHCFNCTELKPLTDFHRHKSGSFGVYTKCKACCKMLHAEAFRAMPIEKKLWKAAKQRAKEKELQFNIELSDVVIPDTCPVFGTPMKRPSIDRIDSTLGYVKGNIRVVSWRANSLKNNATLAELKSLLNDAVRIGTK